MIYFDPENLDKVAKELKNTPPSPGYCIFIDICDSTKIKSNKSTINQWASSIFVGFYMAQNFVIGNDHKPIKVIGDCLMYYILENKIKPDKLLEKLKTLHDFKKEGFKKEVPFTGLKTSVVYCDNEKRGNCCAYGLTYEKNRVDYYGSGIDMASRQLNIAIEGDVIVNEKFIKKLDENSKKCFFGPWPYRFKGFDEELNLYKLKTKTTFD